MKTEDIERLKEICEKEGFEVLESPFSHGLFKIGIKKDPWEGVEFVELVTAFIGLDLQEGMVGKVISNDGNRIEVRLVNGDICYSNLNEFKPSTEQAYFEQLKKEAFERFREIRHGDQFELPEYGEVTLITQGWRGEQFEYSKKYDELRYCGLLLYNSGKWATKLPERVKVQFIDHWVSNKFNRFDFNVSKEIKSNTEIGQFLTKQLEKYLNDEN